MNKLKIGWSEISITPDKKVSLAGQFAERISEYVEKPITATALVEFFADEENPSPLKKGKHLIRLAPLASFLSRGSHGIYAFPSRGRWQDSVLTDEVLLTPFDELILSHLHNTLQEISTYKNII